MIQDLKSQVDNLIPTIHLQLVWQGSGMYYPVCRMVNVEVHSLLALP